MVEDGDSQAIASMAAALARKKAAKRQKQMAAAAADKSSSSEEATLPSLPQSHPSSSSSSSRILNHQGGMMDIASLAAAAARQNQETKKDATLSEDAAKDVIIIGEPPPPPPTWSINSRVVLPAQQLQRPLTIDEGEKNDVTEGGGGALLASFPNRQKHRLGITSDEVMIPPQNIDEKEAPIHTSSTREALLSAIIQNRHSDAATSSIDNNNQESAAKNFNDGGGNNDVRGDRTTVQQSSITAQKEGGGGGMPSMSIAAMAAAAARKKRVPSSPPEEKGGMTSSDQGLPMSIAAMAAAAARKKATPPSKSVVSSDSSDGGSPTCIAAMAAAAARKKRVPSSPPEEKGGITSSDQGLPMSIAAMAAAAARKKATPPSKSAVSSDSSDGGSPTCIAAMAAAAARKKRVPSSPPEEKGGITSSDQGLPMSIAAMAAAAARKKATPPSKSAVSSDSSDGGSPTCIAAMAAAAARKKRVPSSPPEEKGGITSSDQGLPMSIAAMAAAAARKKATPPSKSAVSSDSSDGGSPTCIAPLAAAAARKKALTPKASDDGSRPPNIAALAAAVALKKSSTQKVAERSENDSAPSINIAALAAAAAAAAAAAQEKNASCTPKIEAIETESDSGRGPPMMNGAEIAVAAAGKKESTPERAESSNSDRRSPINILAHWEEISLLSPPPSEKAPDSESDGSEFDVTPPAASWKKTLFPPPPLESGEEDAAPISIAAMAAAAAAQKKASSSPITPELGDGTPNIAVLAAAALRKKVSTSQASDDSEGRPNIAALAAAAALRKVSSPTLADTESFESPPRINIAAMAAAAAQKKALTPLTASESDSDSSSPPMSIAASAAAAAQKKASRPKVVSENSRGPPTLSLSAMAAKAAKLKTLTARDVEGPFSRRRERSYDHSTHEQEHRHPHNDSAELNLSSLRSSATPSRSLDKVRERRERQIYDDNFDDSFDFAEESPSDDVHDKVAQALLRVIRMKNLDFDNVIEKLEDLGRCEKGTGSNHGRRDKGNRRQERKVINADPLNTPENDNVHDDDLSSIGDLSTESADHRRLAKNARKLANHIMQTPQREFAAKKVPLKEDPEYNLYFRMLRYGFTIGAVRAALSRDNKPDVTRLDPDRPLCVQKVPRALDRFSRQDSVEVAGLEIGHDGVTDEGWEHALSSAMEASDLSFVSSPGISGSERTRKSNFSGQTSPCTPATPPWLGRNQADRGIVQGWLRKKTRRGRWVRRWYYLDATGMYYSHAPPSSRSTSSKLGKYTKLADTRALKAAKSATNPLEFELWHQCNSHALVTLRADSLLELNQWMDAVSNAIERQRLVDEVVVGHVVPVGELRNKVGVLGGGLFGDGSGDSIGVGGSEDNLLDGDDYGGGHGTAISSRNLRSVMNSESLNDGEGGSALISSAALDEVKRLFTVGSGPLIPQISTPQPKRPMLKRQNSWPPISLMSLGGFVLGNGLIDQKIDDDLKNKPAGNEKKPVEEKDLQLDTDGEPKLKNDPKYAEYFTMLKNGTLKESVQAMMKSKGLCPGILDLDPEKSLKSQQAPKKEDSLKSQKALKKEDRDGEPPLKDDPKYSKYFKMMKMGLPKEAAKHAMKRDGVEDDSILDLDPEKSLKSQQAPKEEDTGHPLKDDPKYSKYFKMLKMGLPKEAAKHAMKRDGVEDDSILDLDPDKSLQSQKAPKEEDTGPPLKDDPKYSKYFKMLKMGLPKEAAKHAMVRDQLDPSILDLDPDKSLKSHKVGGKENTGPPLTDDPKFAKYFKMLKMGLPMGAVKNALVRDGLDPGIIDLGHDKSVNSQLDEKKKSILKGFKITKKPKIRRKKVYWTQVDAREGTVWQEVKSSKIVLDIDIDEFEKLFTQAIDADKERGKKEKESVKSSKKSGTVKVIDSKRGMNGDIILRKVKLSPTEVATLIENMDTGTLDAVELKSLYEFMPTDEEIKSLTAYLESSKDKTAEIRYMTPCEQYMVAMKDLKDSDKKFQCIIFLSEFGHKMKELKYDVDHLSAACEQLRSSKRFRTLLQTILILVNKINTGEEGGAIADGFTLDTLAKLNETKAFDNRTTVLYYLVKLIRKTNIDVLKFTQDIKDVVLAKGVSMERLLTSAKQLCEGAKVAEETAAKDGDLYRQSLNDPSQHWKFTNKFTNVKAQKRSVKEIRQMVTFLTEKDVPVCRVDSTHFERFAAFAKLELQQALEVIKKANKQFIEILEFFGEDINTQVADFFGIIDQFMITFDQTQDQVEKEEEEKLKAARRALAKEAKLKVQPAFKNAADATTMADEKSSQKGLVLTMESSRKVLREVPKANYDKLDNGTARPSKDPQNVDSRHALFAALKSRRVENDLQNGDVTVSAASHQDEDEGTMEEDRKKEAEEQFVRLEREQQQSCKERASLAEIQRKENIKKLEEGKKKIEQEAALRAKIEAEDERKRKEGELQARIDAIEEARREERERNDRSRKAEQERKREKLERQKREQDELRARIEVEAMALKELEGRRHSIEQRHKAKDEEEALREREAREEKKKELRAKIMAAEKAQRDSQERKGREMELRARICEESRNLQEDTIDDDLRAWLSKKERMKSSGNISSSIKHLPDGSASRPKPSRQPSRLSMAVAQAAASKQRRDSSRYYHT